MTEESASEQKPSAMVARDTSRAQTPKFIGLKCLLSSMTPEWV